MWCVSVAPSARPSSRGMHARRDAVRAGRRATAGRHGPLPHTRPAQPVRAWLVLASFVARAGDALRDAVVATCARASRRVLRRRQRPPPPPRVPPRAVVRPPFGCARVNSAIPTRASFAVGDGGAASVVAPTWRHAIFGVASPRSRRPLCPRRRAKYAQRPCASLTPSSCVAWLRPLRRAAPRTSTAV